MALNTQKFIRIIKKSADQNDEFEIVDISKKKHLIVRTKHLKSNDVFNVVLPLTPSNTAAAEKCTIKMFKKAHQSFTQCVRYSGDALAA